jgi:urocanate hydratase
MGGIARRCWARNPNAFETAYKWNIENKERGQLTLPYIAEDKILDNILNDFFK